MDWKRGFTRLYVVGWGLWLVALASRTVFALAQEPDYLMGAVVFVLLGMVLPGCLLAAFRWALDGFTATGRSG